MNTTMCHEVVNADTKPQNHCDGLTIVDMSLAGGVSLILVLPPGFTQLPAEHQLSYFRLGVQVISAIKQTQVINVEDNNKCSN